MTNCERQPLLQDGAVKAYGTDDRCGTSSPLDLPRSTRYGILLGVWIANFLSVSEATIILASGAYKVEFT